MKKVLIITYYWPPGGGAGVYRWLKMSKYLPEYGWQPVIYTADNADYPVVDNTLNEEVRNDITVLRHKIFEPYQLYRLFTGKKKEDKIHSGLMDGDSTKMSLTKKIAVWIRGNIFIPDARKFWIKPSVKYLSAYLKDHPVDAIISTGPPHTTHLIAKGVKKRTGIKWIADFRDPWTQIDFYDQLMLSKSADAKHKRLERSVLQYADKVVTVSQSWALDMEKLGGRKIDVVHNGYDSSDYENKTAALDTKFSICHSGMLNADRNPVVLWKTLQVLCAESNAFKNDLVIRLIGKNDPVVYADIDRYGLTNNLQLTDYLPHKEVAIKQKESAVNLLPINNTPNLMGIIPGKLFEYLAAQRPVLLIGPAEGDSAKIILQCSAGKVCGYEDTDTCKAVITDMYTAFKNNTLTVQTTAIEQYSRKELAGKYAALLNDLTATT